MAISPIAERGGYGFNVLPVPQQYSVSRAYDAYLRIASQIHPITITNHDRGFVPDQFPGIAMTMIREASFVRDNSSYSGMPAFTLLGVMDAAAIVGGVYLAEKKTQNTSTFVTFPPDIQKFIDENDMIRRLQKNITNAQPQRDFRGNRALHRRTILVGFFNEAIAQKRMQLQGKFDSWELAMDDYMLGVDLLLRRWQSLSTQA